jgi:hypothetical protein
LRPPGRGVA